MSKLRYWYAMEKDLPRIVETYNSTIAGRMVTADLEPVSIESRRAWFLAHDQDKRPLWIIENEGIYAGWMGFSSFYGRPAYEGTVELSIYLEETARGKGLGELCLLRLTAEAEKRKLHTLLGFIFAHNLPSIRLFEKAGFEKWGLLPGTALMDGIYRDLVIFGKKLR